MIWLMVVTLALAIFGMMAFIFRLPRASWAPVGTALLLGISGFALQTGPGLPGAPKEAAQSIAKSGAALVAARQQLSGAGNAGGGNSWVVISDALARNGQYGDAAGIVLGAVEKDPKNADAWLSLGNNLVGHAEGTLTPAAIYAYQRAASADPKHPGPAFFMGLAMAQNGKLQEGRALWAMLLAQSPADAPWRADLAKRLERLDAFIAAQGAAVGDKR